MAVLRPGDTITPLAPCEVARILSSGETKSTYEVVWKGVAAVLKVSAQTPLAPADHPLWASILDTTVLPEGHAVVQERISGSTLSTVLKFGKPSREQRLHWAVDLCRFFEVASPLKGELEASNVIVEEGDGIRVVSLGSADVTPMASLGRFLELSLSDSAPVAWLAARCQSGAFTTLGQVSALLEEFAAGEEPNLETDVAPPVQTSGRPSWWAPAMGALAIVVTLSLILWHRPLVRREPAIYLTNGSSLSLISEASGRSLGSLHLDGEITAIASSKESDRLYVAGRDSPYIEVIDGTDHRPLRRMLSQPGASELLVSGKYLVALYPKLHLVAVFDTESGEAKPLTVGEGELRAAVANGYLAISFKNRLETYRLSTLELLKAQDVGAGEIRTLSSNGNGMLVSAAGKVFSLDPATGALTPVSRQDIAADERALETPHGYWTLDSKNLAKMTGKGGSVVVSWPVSPGADITYLDKMHAP